ncbi:MAG: di-heme oxidoredictase family protein, partial [Verrucomicrobiota bacterium]
MNRLLIQIGLLIATAIRVQAEAPSLSTTVEVPFSGSNAFSYPFPILDRQQRRAFAVGNAFFKDNWVQAPSSSRGRDGLGPFFNARSCSTCHPKDGRGRPMEKNGEKETGLLFRLPQPHALFGSQIQDLALPSLEPEGTIDVQWEETEGHYADGTPYSLVRANHRLSGSVSKSPPLLPRIAPHLIGLGLLESIPLTSLQKAADPEDADGDGISGRLRLVPEINSGKQLPGRFGWKSEQPTVEQQVARAFQQDLGITSPLFPHENTTPAQKGAIDRTHSGGAPEIDAHKLQRVVFYSQTLAIPARRNPEDPTVRQGEALFRQLQCARCHQTDQTVGAFPPLPELEGLV